MGTLVFVCPATGLESLPAWKWIVTRLLDLPSVLPDIRCPHCPKPHQLCDVTARLVEGVGPTDEALGKAATLSKGLFCPLFNERIAR